MVWEFRGAQDGAMMKEMKREVIKVLYSQAGDVCLQQKRKLRGRKVPGILLEVVKIANEDIPKRKKMCNELIKQQTFLDSWKKARLVLMPKPGKDLSIFEIMVPARLKGKIEEDGD